MIQLDGEESLCGDVNAILTVDSENDDYPDDNSLLTELFVVCENSENGKLSMNVINHNFELDSLACVQETGENDVMDIKINIDLEIVCIDIECSSNPIDYSIEFLFSSSNPVDRNYLDLSV